MITLKGADEINVNAAVLPSQRDPAAPPAIELREALVQGYVRVRRDGDPVVVANLHIDGVDDTSVLASNGTVLFEVRVAGRVAARYRVALDTGAVTAVSA